MPESPGMTRWILVSLGGFSYLPEDSEDIPFGISGLAPSFIYIPLISPSLIVWYGNCSTESQLEVLWWCRFFGLEDNANGACGLQKRLAVYMRMMEELLRGLLWH